MSRQGRIAEVAERYIKDEKFAGIEWLVEARGSELARGQAGFADAERKTPIPDGAIYRIYSMTKPVVSVMALILVGQGRLRLYDFLGALDPRFENMTVILPSGEVQPAQRPITVEDLLTHRAGFTYDFITGCHVGPLYAERDITSDGQCSLDDMMGRLAELPLAFQPGSQFRYSVCTDVLAHVVERAAERQIDDLLKEHIFDPLGMTDTAYFVPAEKRDRLMPLYGPTDLQALSPLEPHPHELTRSDDEYVENMYPSNQPGRFRRGGHGLFASLEDYGRFARMLLDGRTADGAPLLSRKTIEMMRANRIPQEQLPLMIGMNALPGYGWGLGVRVMLDLGQAQSLTGIGELGWAGAASTYFWVDPLEQMIGVVMTQYLASMLPLTDDLRAAAYQSLA